MLRDDAPQLQLRSFATFTTTLTDWLTGWLTDLGVLEIVDSDRPPRVRGASAGGEGLGVHQTGTARGDELG